MQIIKTTLTFILCVLVSHTAIAQLVVEDPRYQIINTFGVPEGLNSPLGTMMFSADGTMVYILDDSEDTDSAISTAAVIREGRDGNVLGFGTFTQVFAYPDMDTGLEYGPGTDTLFFRVYPYELAQRLSDGTIEITTLTGYDSYYGGFAFIPDSYTHGGDIVSSEYEEYYKLYKHEVTPDGDGSFTVNGEGTLYSDFTDADEYYVSDLIFITSGPLANRVMVALYDGTNSLVHFPLDADGLPEGGVSVTPEVFASGVTGAWGVAIDPITDNIWMIDYGTTDGIALTQIGEIPPPVQPSLFVPIVPCRLVDSRKEGAGGPFGNETTRSFDIWGDEVSDQGGSDDCGIPPNAVAVHVNFTAVNPSGFGFLRAWPYGQDEPGATLMAFTAGTGVSNATALAVCTQCTHDIYVKIYQAPTDLVADAVGYYVPIMPTASESQESAD